MTEDQWHEYQNRTKKWAIRVSYELIHSEAYKALNYAPALKVLNWFHEKIKVSVNKKRRGKDRYIVDDGDISFPYREAKVRGLSNQQYSKALRELHKVGFVDIKKPGSSLKGDWTLYAMSDRWKDFGRTSFREVEFPRSIHWRNFGPFKEKS
jgi:hypothetical protein